MGPKWLSNMTFRVSTTQLPTSGIDFLTVSGINWTYSLGVACWRCATVARLLWTWNYQHCMAPYSQFTVMIFMCRRHNLPKVVFLVRKALIFVFCMGSIRLWVWLGPRSKFSPRHRLGWVEVIGPTDNSGLNYWRGLMLYWAIIRYNWRQQIIKLLSSHTKLSINITFY